jgi:hypothetical protein
VPRSFLLVILCVLAIAGSSLGSSSTTAVARAGASSTGNGSTISHQAARSLPLAAWLDAEGDEDDDVEGLTVEEGFAPPGAERVAGINYLGSLPWQIANGATDRSYAIGYSTQPSYLPGQTIDLKVSTTSPTFDVSLWRFANTGPDQPFALVASRVGLNGSVGAVRTVNPTSRMVSVNWAVAAQITIPADAPSGIYLTRLAGSTNTQSYVPIVVRKAAAAKYLYVVPSMTWQAYNVWGGTSLYQSIGIASATGDGTARARAVSYDRPYLTGNGFPFFGAEDMVIIKWLQQEGYDVAFTTDTDLSIDPSTQALPKAVIIGGHSEYWSTTMYDWLNSNINIKGRFGLASFGANSGYWSCTMPDGGRTERCLKRGASKTAKGIDNLRYMKRPEQAIFGAEFGVIAVGGGPINLSTEAWATGLLTGTGLKAGSSLGLIAGYEVDQVHLSPDVRAPNGNQCGVLSCKYNVKFGTSTIRQRAVKCACPYNAAPLHGHTMIRKLPSGRRVFAAGSLWWGYGLDPVFAANNGVPAGFDRLMANIMVYVAR